MASSNHRRPSAADSAAEAAAVSTAGSVSFSSATFPSDNAPRPPAVAAVNTCVICLDVGLTPGSTATLDGCNHVFHYGCIKNWVDMVPTCPSCRAKVSVVILNGLFCHPLPHRQIRIKVLNCGDNNARCIVTEWHSKFVLPIVADYEEEYVRMGYWPHGGPGSRLHYGRDVVIFHNGSVVKEDATPARLRMEEHDTILIRHKVDIIFHMPDNCYKFWRAWWDNSISSLFELMMADDAGLDVDDYWFVHNGNVINGMEIGRAHV